MISSESSKVKYPRGVTIIGTGRLGSALAKRLHRKGYRLYSLFNRSMPACKSLAGRTGTAIYGTFPESLSDLGDLVFLALPDDQIAGFAEKAADRLGAGKGTKWIHTSGATPAGVLEPLSKAGAQTASFHPVQTFNEHNEEQVFDHCFITLQGDRPLCEELKLLVVSIGGRPLIVDQKQKTAIHLAAVLLCNYYAALFSGSQEILDKSGVEVHSRDLFGPIVEQTIEALLNNPPHQVLTGPIARGDTGSVEKHLELLRQLPGWDRIYRELGLATLSLAKKIPDRDVSSDEALHRILRDGEP